MTQISKTDPALLQSPGQTPGQAALTPDQAKLKKACQDFEAIFLRFILRKMRDTVPKDGLLGNSDAQDTYRQMLDSALADEMSKSGSFGLGELLYKQMSERYREASQIAVPKPDVEEGATPGKAGQEVRK